MSTHGPTLTQAFTISRWAFISKCWLTPVGANSPNLQPCYHGNQTSLSPSGSRVEWLTFPYSKYSIAKTTGDECMEGIGWAISWMSGGGEEEDLFLMSERKRIKIMMINHMSSSLGITSVLWLKEKERKGLRFFMSVSVWTLFYTEQLSSLSRSQVYRRHVGTDEFC